MTKTHLISASLSFFVKYSIYFDKMGCGVLSGEVSRMRILKNLTREELDYYASRPTAKEMHERIMKDSVYIPEGEASAAAVPKRREIGRIRWKSRRPGGNSTAFPFPFQIRPWFIEP